MTTTTTHDPLTRRLLQSLTLEALLGFEAAARLLSFTGAADELCVTQSAVSKQVKSIEAVLGRALFVRGARTLRLTDDGRRLHDAVREAIGRLGHAVRAVHAERRRTVSITVPPALGSLWLAPRLAAYHAADPDTDIRMDASEAVLALEREGFDLAVRLSPPGQEPAGGELLGRERLVLVAAPSLAGAVHAPQDLLRCALVEFEHAVSRHAGMGWDDWWGRLGLPGRPQGRPLYRFSQYEHALKAAVEGMGVAIGRLPLVQGLIDEGRLVPVLAQWEVGGLAYRLVHAAPGMPDREEVRRLADWLRAAFTPLAATDGRGGPATALAGLQPPPGR